MNIYEEYGKAMIQIEMWNGYAMELKKKIASEMPKIQKFGDPINDKVEGREDGSAERPA